MASRFFERRVLYSPYECPSRHWALDKDGQSTQQVVENRRPAQFIKPIPKPRPDGIACWFIDTDYNEESFFVGQAYFHGADDRAVRSRPH